MELEPDQIGSKEHVGWLGEDPVYELVSKGGRAWVVSVHKGRVEPLGVGAPHTAIARSIAKRVRKDIKWNTLAKSHVGVDENSRVYARYEEATRLTRAAYGY